MQDIVDDYTGLDISGSVRRFYLKRFVEASASAIPYFIRLTPNYTRIWQSDSDAAVGVSFHEVSLWFKSRGDVCTNCPSEIQMASWKAAPDEKIRPYAEGLSSIVARTAPLLH